MKNIALPVFIVAILSIFGFSSSAHAQYLVRVPAQVQLGVVDSEPDVPEEPLSVTLSSAVLPVGMIGEPYSFDLTGQLAIAGGSGSYSLNDIVWSLKEGAVLPVGLTLSSGMITGVPTVRHEDGATFEIVAQYLDASGSQEYQLQIKGVDVTVKNFGAYRAWSDGSLAKTCLDYRQGSSGYLYQGATGNGVYRISPDGQAVNVYCDMITEGGGWTVVLVAKDLLHYPGTPVSQASDASPPTPGQAANTYLAQAPALAIASKASTVRIYEPFSGRAIWSSHPVVMGNLREGRIANYSTSESSDPTSYWSFSESGFVQMSHSCASWLTPENAHKGRYPFFYWACGNTYGLHLNASQASWSYSLPNQQMVLSYR